jgi:hypothetical protein
MNSTLSKVLIFATGAAIGSLVTWKFIKTKYEKFANEEIQAMREYYFESTDDVKEEDTLIDVNEEKPDTMSLAKQYENRLGGLGYGGSNKEVVEVPDYISIITPEEFGEEDGYKTESLTYYADGYVTDDRDNIIDDVDDLIGLESLEHFGEYEEDSVFVRNDKTKKDYEILKSYDTYYPSSEETE